MQQFSAFCKDLNYLLTLWHGQEPGVVSERAGGGEPQLQALHRPHRARGVPHPAPAYEEGPQEKVHILGVQVRQVERRRVKILRGNILGL